MADIYGEQYNKEWIADPAEQADKATRNARSVNFWEVLSPTGAADVLYICKIQHLVRFIKLEAIVGTLGAGAIQVIDKDGNATAVSAGDQIDGAVEGGLDFVLIADGATSTGADALKVLAKFLMD